MENKHNPATKHSSRRSFVKNGFRAAVAFTIVPRFVLGGKGYLPPSDRINLVFIGTGKQSKARYTHLKISHRPLQGLMLINKNWRLFKGLLSSIMQKPAKKQLIKDLPLMPISERCLSEKIYDAIVLPRPTIGMRYKP